MLLEATKVTKAFGGLYANSEIDFSIDEGEIVAIIGPNGSGRKAGISENLCHGQPVVGFLYSEEQSGGKGGSLIPLL